MKEKLNVTKSTCGDVSVPIAVMRKSADEYGKGVCR